MNTIIVVHIWIFFIQSTYLTTGMRNISIRNLMLNITAKTIVLWFTNKIILTSWTSPRSTYTKIKYNCKLLVQILNWLFAWIQMILYNFRYNILLHKIILRTIRKHNQEDSITMISYYFVFCPVPRYFFLQVYLSF